MANQGDSSAPRVVVIDDDISHLRFCAIALGNAYAVSCFPAPSDDAKDHAVNADCVILDINMRPLDGLSFLNTCAANTALSRTKQQHLVICSAMTTEILESVRSIAMANGFLNVSLLPKPVTKQALVNEIADRIGAPHKQAALKPAAQDIDLNMICRALDQGDITPAWQPQVDVLNRAPTGFEVLARWYTAGRDIQPAEFIPLIESSPLSMRFALYMLDVSLQSIKRWQSQLPYQGLLSINMPAGAFDHPSLSQRIAQLLTLHQFPPQRLVIEITETMDVAKRIVMHTNMARLKIQGVQLSIDDFGMGYSNIDRLSTGLFNEIKIDTRFVQNMASSSRVYNVVRGIIDGAWRSGVRVVAEGVENEASARAMEQLGCTHLQGSLFSLAMTEGDLASWLSVR